MRPLALVPLLALAVLVAGCTDNNAAVQAPPADDAPDATVPPSGSTGGTGGASGGSTTTPPADPLPTQPAEPTSVRQQNVTIHGAAFLPADITVVPGSTVTWTNEDAVPHSVALDDGTPTRGAIDEGEQAALTFPAVGTFAYHCELHPGMKGVVRVEQLAPPTAPSAPPPGAFNVTISGKTYDPGVLRLSQGSTVTWTNLDYEMHEVEADAGSLFASPLLQQGQRFTATLDLKGTFTYRCDLHQMKGTLIVE